MQFARPVMGGISAPFGYSPGYLGGRVKHNGIDFFWLYKEQEASRRVYSAHPGTVADAGYSSQAGNYVLVDIGGGKKLRYIHLHSFAVRVGQRVGYSTFIGVMGSTGTTAVHLHMDLFDGDERVDPEPYLTLPFGYTGPTFTSGASPTPIESEEDDMAHFDLIQTPDKTVWWCVNRATRYAIPSVAAMETYKAFHKELTGTDIRVVPKSHTEILAYGAPVYASPIVASSDTPAILAAIQALPAKTIEALKAAL